MLRFSASVLLLSLMVSTCEARGFVRHLLRGSVFRFRIQPSCLIVPGPSCDCEKVEVPVLEPASQSENLVPLSLQPGIALEPRPGTGLLPLIPGRKPEPEVLIPGKGIIDLAPLERVAAKHLPTAEQLSAVGGKLDSFLGLLSVILSVFAGGVAMPWAVRGGSGLLGLLGALSRLRINQPSGPPATLPPASQAGP